MSTRRSRKKANELAVKLLEKQRLGDEDVLAVLNLWYFYQNKRRANVIPDGATSVESDTLGLVRTRTGQIVTTGMTRRYTAFFECLCRWQRENQPRAFTKPFCCTSISVNHGYAARKHRDSYNLGPSMTKAFGNFEGGRLLYWPDDNGATHLDELRTSDAVVFESKREMLLFDGKRCHSVTNFKGERYSLVFFTLLGFEKVREEDKEILKGLTWPTEGLQEYWRSILAPPKGLQQSGIRSKLFRVEDLPGAIQYSLGRL